MLDAHISLLITMMLSYRLRHDRERIDDARCAQTCRIIIQYHEPIKFIISMHASLFDDALRLFQEAYADISASSSLY